MEEREREREGGWERERAKERGEEGGKERQSSQLEILRRFISM